MAKKYTCEATARNVVLIINVIFLLFGVVIIAIGVIGYNKANDIRNSQILSAFSIDILTIIVFASGIGTIIAAIIGFSGAWLRHLTLLKIYSVFVFIVVGIQFAIGIYLTTLDVNTLRTAWEEDDPQGQGRTRRYAFQDYLHCCGFDYWTDSIGQLQTDCPYRPINPGDSAPPSCKQAAYDFVKTWIGPVWAAAITIACLELTALATTCFIIFKNRGKSVDTAFDY